MNNRPKKQESPFTNANRLVAVMLFFSWVFFILTIGITAILFFPFILANLLLAVFYKLRTKSRFFSYGVYVLRATVILILFVQLASPVIGLGFSENKAIYPVKRAVFGYGVQSGEYMDTFLPKKLPEKCDNYYFRTQLIFPAQDYHPGAYLAFHCDEKYFDEYIDYAVKKGFENKKREESLDDYIREYIGNADSVDDIGDEYMAEVIAKYVGIPLYAFYIFREEHRNMLTEDAELYYLSGAGTSCVFDKKTGLMLFWT